jgi:hypothetical protein
VFKVKYFFLSVRPQVNSYVLQYRHGKNHYYLAKDMQEMRSHLATPLSRGAGHLPEVQIGALEAGAKDAQSGGRGTGARSSVTRLFQPSPHDEAGSPDEESEPHLECNELFLDNCWALPDYFARVYDAFMAASPSAPQEENHDPTA